MLKYEKKYLTILLTVLSVLSLINVLIMYWIPLVIPLNSFFAVRLTFVALVEKRYYLILLSVLIIVFLFLVAMAVRRQRILLPTLALPYLIFDFIIMLPLFIDGLDDGYWVVYISQVIVSIAIIVMLCVYCWKALQAKIARKNK